MQRLSMLVAFVLASGVSLASAAAQADDRQDDKNGHGRVDVRDRRDDKRPDEGGVVVRDRRDEGVRVTRFSPQAGPPGAVVTIVGNGFTRATRVFVDGRPTPTRSVTDEELTFAMPRSVRDGLIVVRHPGVARDVPVGQFDLIAPPILARFSPHAGPPGTRVEITGSGFRPGDNVLLGAIPLLPTGLTPNRFVVEIPLGASGAFFAIERAGQTFRSRQAFRVVLPRPEVTGFAPASGPPGTLVRLTGRNFSGTESVYFGASALLVQKQGPEFFEVAVPTGATRGERFEIRAPGLRLLTQAVFVLVLPPQIVRIAPTTGPVGTRLSIFGAHFLPGDRAQIGGRDLAVVSTTPTVVVADVVAGVPSGNVSLLRDGNVVATSAAAFARLEAPMVTSFAPAQGPPGTLVHVGARHVPPSALVFYGAQRLAMAGWRNERTGSDEVVFQVRIPAGARDNYLIVRTAGGEAKSASPFAVRVNSEVTGLRPSFGPAGTTVTLTGRDFQPGDSFSLGGLPLAVTRRTPIQVTAVIPPHANDGFIEWTSADGVLRTSRFRFSVLVNPAILALTPASGPAGTRVVISGDHFTRQSRVFYGSRPLAAVGRITPNELTVIIPPNTTRSEFLWVKNGAAPGRSPRPFELVFPPRIARFVPAIGAPGSDVKIFGANFSASTRFSLGDKDCPITNRINANSVVVRVPNQVAGNYAFVAAEGAMQTPSAQLFRVLGPPPPRVIDRRNETPPPPRVIDRRTQP